MKDERPDAFAALVDRLLASPHYGERWGRYWLDVARYGEDQAHAFQPRLYPNGFRYRDWVVRALNGDLPYDRFILEQIAGDLLDGPDRPDRLAALGLFACGPVYYGDSKKHDQYADRIDTLTRGFLGLTVACARCHDHKYDPIPTTDYYAGVCSPAPSMSRYRQRPGNRSRHTTRLKPRSRLKTRKSIPFSGRRARRLKLKVTANQLKQIERMLPEEARGKVQALGPSWTI